jgi:hypothetical protein
MVKVNSIMILLLVINLEQSAINQVEVKIFGQCVMVLVKNVATTIIGDQFFQA